MLKFDKDKQRVSLGFKQLTPDPWLDAAERYPVGAHVSGRVLSVTDYGAFVELEQGIEGLVHVSEMTWSKRMKHPSKLVNAGDEVDTVVLSVNPHDRRISLGMKQLATNPWEHLAREVSRWDDRRRPRSQPDRLRRLHRNRRRHRRPGPRQQPELDQAREASFGSPEEGREGEGGRAGVEPENRRLSLGIKQLQPDVWETLLRAASRGRCGPRQGSAHGAVRRFRRNRRRRRRPVPHLRSGGWQRPAAQLEPGVEHDFKIIKMNPEEKKVGLSIRAVGEEASRADVEAYKQPAASTGAASTIGEFMSWKRAGNENN